MVVTMGFRVIRVIEWVCTCWFRLRLDLISDEVTAMEGCIDHLGGLGQVKLTEPKQHQRAKQ